MLIFIQWENCTPILFGQVVDDMTAQEVMDFATEQCSVTYRVKSISLVNGNWLVKMVHLEKRYERLNG